MQKVGYGELTLHHVNLEYEFGVHDQATADTDVRIGTAVELLADELLDAGHAGRDFGSDTIDEDDVGEVAVGTEVGQAAAVDAHQLVARLKG